MGSYTHETGKPKDSDEQFSCSRCAKVQRKEAHLRRPLPQVLLIHGVGQGQRYRPWPGVPQLEGPGAEELG